MHRIVWLAAFGFLTATNAAVGSTFTYTSQRLQVGSNGGTGATKVVISYSGTAPAPGGCTLTQQVAGYRDGGDTLKSLRGVGFKLVKTIVTDQDRKVKVTYANVCLGVDGQTVTGQYQIYFSYAGGGVTGTFVVNNLAYYYPGDLVEKDLYFGGEVPQVYSNYSNAQGSWVITP
jgi:hypothetical protein